MRHIVHLYFSFPQGVAGMDGIDGDPGIPGRAGPPGKTVSIIMYIIM